jgi:hypothetical protein
MFSDLPARHIPSQQRPSGDPPPDITRFPGERYFRSGAVNSYVTFLRKMLNDTNAYRGMTIPGQRQGWCARDTAACAALQAAQGWPPPYGRVTAATWEGLVDGTARPVPGPDASLPSATQPDDHDLLSPAPPHTAGRPLNPFPGRHGSQPGVGAPWNIQLRLIPLGCGDDLSGAPPAPDFWGGPRAAYTCLRPAQGYSGAQTGGILNPEIGWYLWS